MKKPLRRAVRPQKTTAPTETLLDQVERELAEDNIHPFTDDNVDEDYLTLPRDITEVTSLELGRFFNAFSQQKMWTRTLIGRVKVNIRELEQSVADAKGTFFKSLPAKTSVKEKELLFLQDEASLGANMQLIRLKEKLQMLDMYIANLEDGIFNISREITRRSSDWRDDKREESMRFVPAGPGRRK